MRVGVVRPRTSASSSKANANRCGPAWSLHLDAGQAGRSAKAVKAGLQRDADPPSPADTELTFQLDEVREARLVPVIDFKGRGRAAARAAG